MKYAIFTKPLLLILLLTSWVSRPLWGAELYLLPQDNRKALSAIVKSIDHSKKSIKIMMYNFTHKKIAKRLKAAAKRGVKVEIIFDRHSALENKKRSMLYFLAKYKNIFVYKLKGKYIRAQDRYGIMHLKSAIFDHRRIVFGSANWTYSAFGANYEVLYVDDDYAKAKRLERYFAHLKQIAEPFR